MPNDNLAIKQLHRGNWRYCWADIFILGDKAKLLALALGFYHIGLLCVHFLCVEVLCRYGTSGLLLGY